MPTAPQPATPAETAPTSAPGPRAVAEWPRWVRIGLWAALAVALLAHLCGLYTPGEPGASEWFPNFDKVLHFLGFGIPATLAVLVVRRWWPIVAFAGHAVVSEIVQGWLLPGRDGDVADVLADLTGLLPALAVWWWLRRGRTQRRASAIADSRPTSRTAAAARRPNA